MLPRLKFVSFSRGQVELLDLFGFLLTHLLDSAFRKFTTVAAKVFVVVGFCLTVLSDRSDSFEVVKAGVGAGTGSINAMLAISANLTTSSATLLSRSHLGLRFHGIRSLQLLALIGLVVVEAAVLLIWLRFLLHRADTAADGATEARAVVNLVASVGNGGLA